MALYCPEATLLARAAVFSRKRLAQFEGFQHRIHDFSWVVDWRELGLPHCHVYVVGPFSRNPVKVGVAVDGLKRLGGLQVGNWQELFVLQSGWAESTSDAFAIEREAHKAMKRYHRLGEWFEIGDIRAIDFVVGAAERLGVPFHRSIPNNLVDTVFDNVRARLSKEFGLGHEELQDIRTVKLAKFGISRQVNDAIRIREQEYANPSGFTSWIHPNIWGSPKGDINKLMEEAAHLPVE